MNRRRTDKLAEYGTGRRKRDVRTFRDVVRPTLSVSIASPTRCAALRATTALSTAALLGLGIAQGAVAQGLPQNGQVIAGSASIVATSPTRLDILQSTDRAVINWDSFNIAAGNRVNIAQPGAGSISIQQVIGPSPSEIFGILSSNGRVVVANPNGIYVGPGALIDVAGIVATTARVSPGNAAGFVAGAMPLVFDVAGRTDASVVNEGTITVADRGLAALVAPGVRNAGLIQARLGEVRLAAGNRMTVDFFGDGLFSFAVTEQAAAVALGPNGQAMAAAVENAGTISATGGRVILTAAAAQGVVNTAINMSGVIEARSASVTQSGAVVLEGTGGSGYVEVSGVIDAAGASAGQRGGDITVDARVFGLTGTIDASGDAAGGRVTVGAATVIHQGTVRADAASGTGGSIAVTATSSYMDVSRAITSARGGAQGGTVAIVADDGAGGGTVFASGTMSADASGGRGGLINLLAGGTITLYDAKLDASGETGGGTVRVGGDWQGGNGVLQALTTTINPSTSLLANARATGDGGTIVVWSQDKTVFAGTAAARGGANAGNGGRIEVSSKNELIFAGTGDAAAPNGTAGSLLLDPKNIIISASGTYPYFDLVNPGSTAGDSFGSIVTLLSGGNIVVTNPNDSDVASNAGAVYLFNGTTGALISTLYGTTASSLVGRTGIATLSNGNYIVSSTGWVNGTAANAGAVTWGSGTSGISGAVSAANSLVGTTSNAYVGIGGTTTLSNGNYVVRSDNWANGTANGAGAVTWGSGTSGVAGVVSATNSLVGTTFGDAVGASGVTALSNGNYIVRSTYWDNGTSTEAGAVTWANGTSGVVGAVTVSNSLIGMSANDKVGIDFVTLSNGNYVISSPGWANGTVANAGAVTWGNGTAAIIGAVSATNSLVGTTANDAIGGVLALTNGNYVVQSTGWDNGTLVDAGAATWGNGTIGVSGAISSTNSLVGTSSNDAVGSTGIMRLANGNYVVQSAVWDNGTATNAGAVTWGDGTVGVVGAVTSTNSLVGTSSNDRVGNNLLSELTNGNYVVRSTNWANGTSTGAGAVTWGSGSFGVIGAVSAANSLVGTNSNDFIGVGGVTALNNGNYVVSSNNWANGTATFAGAVTWGNGATGVVGALSATNSLVGTASSDLVGSHGIVSLSNGNYVARSPNWNNGTAASAGAVTWGSGTSGMVGAVSATNSLVGTTAGDAIGSGSVTALSNGNYVVRSTAWDNGTGTNAGAVTWGSGTAGVTGAVSATNSLIGTASNASVGSTSIVTLSNGNYVVLSQGWVNGTVTAAGAVTWGSGTSGVVGVLSATNSLVGTTASDTLGSGGILTLSNGNYVIRSPNWDNGAATNAGAVTWGNGTAGVVGAVSATNSLVGTSASDLVGNDTVATLSNGNYLVSAVSWRNGVFATAGAVTWGNGTTGVVGAISATNSIVGTAASNSVGAEIFSDGARFVVRNSTNANRVIMAPVAPGDLSFAFGQSSTVSLTPSIITQTLNAGTALTLQASNDITVSNAILANNPSGNGGALTLQAGRSILLNANITTDNGNLSLIANERLSAGVIDAQRDAGAAVVTMANGVGIDAGTGSVSIDLRDGAGKTNTASGAISLRDITASQITVLNQGPSNGNIALDGTLTASGSGNAIVLSTLGNFVNNAGAASLAAANGRFLVYSTTPASNTLGGLSGNNLYARSYAANAPGTISQTGNLFVHSVTPTLTLTADNQTRSYGAADPTFTYSASGLLGGDTVGYAFTGAPSMTTGATAASNVGTYTITSAAGTAASNVGYTLAYANGTLTVNPATLTITANSFTRAVNAANPSFTASYSGFVNGETSALVTGLNLATSATQSAPAGTYSIVPSGASAANYTLVYVNGVLTVQAAQASQTGGGSTSTLSAATSQGVVATQRVANFVPVPPSAGTDLGGFTLGSAGGPGLANLLFGIPSSPGGIPAPGFTLAGAPLGTPQQLGALGAAGFVNALMQNLGLSAPGP